MLGDLYPGHPLHQKLYRPRLVLLTLNCGEIIDQTKHCGDSIDKRICLYSHTGVYGLE